jgi:hypothetical protein
VTGSHGESLEARASRGPQDASRDDVLYVCHHKADCREKKSAGVVTQDAYLGTEYVDGLWWVDVDSTLTGVDVGQIVLLEQDVLVHGIGLGHSRLRSTGGIFDDRAVAVGVLVCDVNGITLNVSSSLLEI